MAPRIERAKAVPHRPFAGRAPGSNRCRAGTGDLIFRLTSPDRPDYREWIWDQAAGSLLVTEAGGRVSDLAGAELDFSRGRRLERNRGVLGSNGRLHPAALRALQRGGGGGGGPGRS